MHVGMRAESLLSCLTLCDPMNYSCQAPLSMRFSMQEYLSELPCLPPGALPNPEIESALFVSCIGRCSLALAPPEKSKYIHINNPRSCCCAKSLQSCPTLCDPTDGSPPGSPIPGVLQARTLEWVAISQILLLL